MITLELIILLASVTFGIAIYWLEYQNNGMYRAVNKLTHSSETQMKATNKKGFIIQQSFVPRLIYVNVLFIVLYLIAYFLLPFITLSLGYYSTTIVGTMIGIYIGQFLLGIKSTSEDVIDKAHDTGKDIVDKGKSVTVFNSMPILKTSMMSRNI